MSFVKILGDSWETYERTIELVIPLGILVLFVSGFLMLASTYIAGGAGFVNYSSILVSNPVDALVILVVSIAGLFAFSYLSVGVSALVKFKRTLDDISFIKLANRAVMYSVRVSIGWFFLALLSFIVGVALDSIGLKILIPVAFVIIWWGAIFLPQTVVFEDLGFARAFSRSMKYSVKNWPQVLGYYVFGVVLVFLLLLAETGLEQLEYFYWTAPFISSIILFLIIVPFLEILKCEWYISRYKITTAGLK